SASQRTLEQHNGGDHGHGFHPPLLSRRVRAVGYYFRYAGGKDNLRETEASARSRRSPRSVAAGRPGQRGFLAFHQPGFDGEYGGTGAIRDVELSEYRRDVGLDRLLRDEEALGDLAVRRAGREEAEYLLLARRELRQLRAVGRGLARLELAH